jgi:putative glycosyltransferase (TIGR04372 family)
MLTRMLRRFFDRRRRGEPTTPRGPGFYAHSALKADWLDVFLCAACRFFVGVTSGLSHVPPTFGVPCALTNWASNALPVHGGRDRFIPKLLRSDAEGRALTFAEALAPAVRKLNYCGALLRQNGLREVDNSPDEILDLVEEMFEVVEGAPASTDEDERRQRAFWEVAVRGGLGGFSRVGRAFLRAHADLLPCEAAPRHALVPSS